MWSGMILCKFYPQGVVMCISLFLLYIEKSVRCVILYEFIVLCFCFGEELKWYKPWSNGMFFVTVMFNFNYFFGEAIAVIWNQVNVSYFSVGVYTNKKGRRSNKTK